MSFKKALPNCRTVLVSLLWSCSWYGILWAQARPSAIDHKNDVSSQLASLDSVDVTWTIPSSNNAPITGYTLSLCQIGPDGNASCGTDNDFPIDLNNPPNNLVSVSSTQLRYRFGNVVPQQMYEVRIRAANEVGLRGKPVEGDGHRFRSAVPADGQTANLSFIRTTTVIILTWDLPALAIATTGLNVSFNVSYFRGGSPNLVNSATVDNIQPLGFSANLSDTGGAQHTFRVIANYSSPILESSPAEMMNVATLGQGESLMPAARVTNNTVGNRLTVSWPPPENKNFLRVYIVSYTTTTLLTSSGRRRRQAGTPMNRNISTDMMSTSLPFQPFSNYTVTVSAVYAPPPSGDDVAVLLIPSTTFSTPERNPGPPILTSVVNIGILKIQVTWTAPTQPNGLITGYELIVTATGGRLLSVLLPNVLTWTSANFSPDTLITVRVRAGNNAGEGVLSDPLSIRTRFGVSQPFITTPVIGTADSPQFTIRYGPFSTDFGSLSTYQIVVIESSEDIDTKQLRKENLLPQNLTSNNYYVVFSGPAYYYYRRSFTIGTGNATQHNGMTYPNPPPSTCVDYRVFIRVYSGIDVNVFNDSDLTPVLRIPDHCNGIPDHYNSTTSAASQIMGSMIAILTAILSLIMVAV